MPSLPKTDLAVALERRIVETKGFEAFVRLAWSQVEPAEFVDNWHITEICHVLESVARDRRAGITREVSLEVPPSSSKSLLASVLWQPWVWTWWPQSRWISCTYEQELASDHSRLSRVLVSSDWYQARWPLRLTKDADSHWSNEVRGWRRATGIGGAVTGKHAHFHLGDDLIKEQLARLGTASQISESVGKAVSFWFTTMGTRKVSKSIARLLINQRLHPDDPSGVAVREHGYEQVMFPARLELARKDRRDHRTVEGDVLCSERCDEEGYRAIELAIGPVAASAQLQQNPSPPGGMVLQPEWLDHRYDVLPAELRQTLESGRPGPGQRWITAWDLNFKGKEGHSRVAGQVWVHADGCLYLIDAVVGQVGFSGALSMIRDLTARYPWVAEHLLEDAANASAVEDTLRREVLGIRLEPVGGGALARTQSVCGLWAAGQVVLPRSASFMGGASGFVAEHQGFDGMKTRPDDQVAASSLALVYLGMKKATPRWARALAGARS